MVPGMPSVPKLYLVEIIGLFLVKYFEVRGNITNLRNTQEKSFLIK